MKYQKNKNTKFRLACLLVLCLFSCEAKTQYDKGLNKNFFYPVLTVIDGDTFWIRDEKGKIVKIRLIGIDAPESRKSEHKDVQRFCKESGDFLKKTLKGKRVRLEYDVRKFDRYYRTLAYVYLEDDTFLNDYLVRKGYAKAVTFQPNVKFQEQLIKSEQYARQHHLGMWKNN